MPKISPFLWFDTQAEEAANFYVSVFPNSKILSVARYGDAGPGPKGSVMFPSSSTARRRTRSTDTGRS